MKAREYGIKAYGKWTYFDTKKRYREYLEAWVAGTDGAEQERAVCALAALEAGQCTYDSDM